jgi:hypothetical protein
MTLPVGPPVPRLHLLRIVLTAGLPTRQLTFYVSTPTDCNARAAANRSQAAQRTNTDWLWDSRYSPVTSGGISGESTWPRPCELTKSYP